jgi:hypothetical protein
MASAVGVMEHLWPLS